MKDQNYKAEVVRDPLAEATKGKHHWNDPGMDDLEEGDEIFSLGTRVEVLVNADKKKLGCWLKGTVIETINENGRAIVVVCDKKWHNNLSFYKGKGATVPVYMNTRRGIWKNIRLIPEPRRKVVTILWKHYQLEKKTKYYWLAILPIVFIKEYYFR